MSERVYGTPVRELIADAWGVYVQTARIEDLDPAQLARRQNAFVSGCFAGLEIARGVTKHLREAAHEEHARVAKANKVHMGADLRPAEGAE